MSFHRPSRVAVLAVASATVLASAGCSSSSPSSGQTPGQLAQQVAAVPPAPVRVDLRTLVIDDGSYSILALTDRLTKEGVLFDTVALYQPHEPITQTSLAASDADGVHARYSGIIAPSLDAVGLSASEREAIETYRKAFNIRMVRTNVTSYFTTPESVASPSGGPVPTKLDGAHATVTRPGLDGPFGYLTGSFTLDTEQASSSSQALLASRPPRLPQDATYEPLVTVAAPGGQGALVALQTAGGLEEMDVPLELDPQQSQAQILAHGLVAWVNRSVETSHSRNYYAVQFDDVLLPNSQWNDTGHCLEGRNCPADIPQLGPVRMTAEDVDYAIDWQTRNDFKLDLVINGAGSAQYAQEHGGRDPLTERMKDRSSELRIVSHTWSHLFMGCEQVLMPDAWRCVADENGQPKWQSEKALREQLVKNQEFINKNKFPNVDTTEVVTGEHSGLAKRPEQMEDNPNLGPAFTDAGIVWAASDASEPGDMNPRTIGSATTVPRYPINLPYDTPTNRQAADMYNHNFTDRAHGGSGACETDPSSPCVAPIDVETGYLTVLVPQEVDAGWTRVVGDNPRPHFVHQSNLTGDRTIYPIVDGVLTRYRSVFSAEAPLIDPTLGQAGTVLVNHDNWAGMNRDVDVHANGRIVTVANHAATKATVPLTLPDGTKTVENGHLTAEFGEPYAGTRSAWVELEPGATATFQVPEDQGFATTATWPVTR